jgi:hypothetical protein
MSPDISERAFEEAIEHALVAAPPKGKTGAVSEPVATYGDAPGGYLRRPPEAYDRTLCQLQNTMRQFEQTLGVVENIDTTSKQLKQALEEGKTIIVTTLQKFPVVAKEIGELPGKCFAVIVDEAHSSQTRESTRSLKAVLASTTLEEAEREEEQEPTEEELEALSRTIAELNERFGLNLGPEHRVTLSQMMARLDDDTALDAAARVNTRENVRLTFDNKVEQVIQEIVDTNFDLYKRITDDRAFGAAVKSYLFEQFLRTRRNAEELIKRGESKTLEFKSTLRWSLKEDRQDGKGVTHAVLKTIAAFLNTDGGDLLIGVGDDGAIVGIEHDKLESDDKLMRHLVQVVRNGLGDRAGTYIDPRCQVIQGRTACIVACQGSPEPVFLRWKGLETAPDGDFFVRQGPTTVRLEPDSARKYIQTRFRSGPSVAEGGPE